MRNKISLAIAYLRYLFVAQTKHAIHSPFVFSLLTTVIKSRKQFYAYKQVENIRKDMLESKTEITVTDRGAGSSVLPFGKRKISAIAKASSKPAKYAQLLFRLVDHFQPATILELGTSLGISTLYLASPSSKSKVVTIEGCPNTAAVARENFDKLKISNVELLEGSFDDQLPTAIEKLGVLDLVFIDGDHRKAPTLKYFEQCILKAGDRSLFILDDIHWSDEMEEAWEVIKKDKRVTITIDLFFLGLVFFRKEQRKQVFVIRF